VLAAIQQHEEFVTGEMLARRIDYGPVEDGVTGIVGDGVAVRFAVAVVSA
jgi:hypothetical protein